MHERHRPVRRCKFLDLRVLGEFKRILDIYTQIFEFSFGHHWPVDEPANSRFRAEAEIGRAAIEKRA